MIKTRFVAAALGSLLLIAGVAVAQRTKDNVNPARDPNLAAAQRLSRNAFEKIVAAQQANEWDLQGYKGSCAAHTPVPGLLADHQHMEAIR